MAHLEGSKLIESMILCIAKAQRENFLLITNIHSLGLSEEHIGKIGRLAINWKSGDECLQGIKLKKKNIYIYISLR